MQSLSYRSQDVDRWSFDVFALNSASSDHALQTIFFELITKYGLNNRFKVFIFGFLLHFPFNTLSLEGKNFSALDEKCYSNVIITAIDSTFVRNGCFQLF